MLEISTESIAQTKVNPIFRFCSLFFLFLTALCVAKFYFVESDTMLIVMSAMSCAMVLITNFAAKFLAESKNRKTLTQQNQF